MLEAFENMLKVIAKFIDDFFASFANLGNILSDMFGGSKEENGEEEE